MKLYSINKISGSLFSEGKIIQAKDSKKALLEFLGQEFLRGLKEKELRIKRDVNIDYSVIECDKDGRLHYDKRCWVYYGITTNLDT